MRAGGQSALVTGATGLVGAHALRAFAAAGMRVRALVRDRSATLEGAEPCSGDLDDPASLFSACDGIDVVLHAAARLAGDAHSLERTNCAGTLALLEQAQRAGVRRFVFTSSAAVYRDGPLVGAAETFPLGGGGAYGRSKAQAEVELLRARGIETLVLRLPTVYGPGDRHFLPALVQALEQHALPTTVYGGALRDLVHAADVAQAILRALSAPLAGPTVWNLAGPPPLTTRELARLAALALGIEPVFFEVPADLPLDAPGPRWEACTRGLERPALPWHLVPAALVERTLDDRRARAALGWEPATPFASGVLTSLRPSL
jgi:nucleoside-diphosphate-sugar epimerase